MIWIRADGGSSLGLGHIMRCLSVADELKDRGGEVCFVLADESAVPVLEARKQRYIVLHSDFSRMEEELDRLLPLLLGEGPGPVLVDSYYVTERYISCLREHVPVAYMDDMCTLRYPVDMLINYNIFAAADLYSPAVSREGCRMLLGPLYAPLRREFTGKNYVVRDRVKSVLLTTGGSDPYNLAGRFLEKLLRMPECAELDYYVVSGMYNDKLPGLKKLETEHGNVHVRVNEAHMGELMQKCDVAVTAGGSTMYEMSAIGVPVICFSFVDNQERIVRGYLEKGLVCFAGNYLTQGEEMLEGGAEALKALSADRTARMRYSAAQRRLTDGQGAGRIAEEIMGGLGKR